VLWLHSHLTSLYTGEFTAPVDVKPTASQHIPPPGKHRVSILLPLMHIFGLVVPNGCHSQGCHGWAAHSVQWTWLYQAYRHVSHPCLLPKSLNHFTWSQSVQINIAIQTSWYKFGLSPSLNGGSSILDGILCLGCCCGCGRTLASCGGSLIGSGFRWSAYNCWSLSTKSWCCSAVRSPAWRRLSACQDKISSTDLTRAHYDSVHVALFSSGFCLLFSSQTTKNGCTGYNHVHSCISFFFPTIQILLLNRQFCSVQELTFLQVTCKKVSYTWFVKGAKYLRPKWWQG